MTLKPSSACRGVPGGISWGTPIFAQHTDWHASWLKYQKDAYAPETVNNNKVHGFKGVFQFNYML